MSHVGGCVVRLHAGSLGPSIQREVLTDGFLGPAVLSQNRRGSPLRAAHQIASPGFVSRAALQDGTAQFRMRLISDIALTSPLALLPSEHRLARSVAHREGLHGPN